MKRNFTLLTILGALLAMAVPASALSAPAVIMGPSGHKFEIGSTLPQVTSSLAGYCTLAPMTGTVPANPGVAPLSVPISTPSTTASCNGGETVSFNGSWALAAYSPSKVNLAVPVGGVTVRYSSLPGCKLTSTATGTNQIPGFWSNGTNFSSYTASAYHIHGGLPAVWSNDGTTCATAGKTDFVYIRDLPASLGASSSTITNTTMPGALITVTT